MIPLNFKGAHVIVAPGIGGSIRRYDWLDEPILRPAQGASVLDAACFPMVPYCNRIAHGHFAALGNSATLPANVPAVDPDHPMHGHGWLSAWDVTAQDETSVTMALAYKGQEWPWHYRAVQTVMLGAQGLTLTLSVTNLSAAPMPTGLGFHPYFPRDAATIFRSLHTGEWRCGPDRLPVKLDRRDAPIDWWGGQPVERRIVDTVYAGRSGAMTIAWPERNIGVTLAPNDALSKTAIFVPDGKNFFCVEPTTQMTNAVNWPDDTAGTIWLAQGRTLIVTLTLTPHRLHSKGAFQ